MATLVMTWDGSDAGYPPADYAADIATTALGGRAPCRWSVGSRRGGVGAHDRVFLLRQGGGRGIVASGRLADGQVFEDEHWDDPTKTAWYVRVEWDRVLPVESRLPTEELLARVPQHHWNNIMASGQAIQPAADALLQALWTNHVIGLSEATSTAWTLPVGESLGRRARMAAYGGARFGGIQPSKRSPNVFVYSDPKAGTAYGYNYDGWSADGSVFMYTGEGRKGDQRIRSGNAAILSHQDNGRALRLFVADGNEPSSDARIQRYVGEFQLSAKLPYVTAEAPD